MTDFTLTDWIVTACGVAMIVAYLWREVWKRKG